ncbi:MAG: class II aldolase/adducin family protein [Chitinispirillia bacterium]|nr:class II aldolase/adducin family protein [Chitinispirillia bacterium]MCL2241960.1 class II aldolase/adducin family protein [Chitinispirillia bacterium]
MINRWDDVDEGEYLSRYDGRPGKIDGDLLRMAYATTLLGAENDLTMHGGGNTSVKKIVVDNSGNERRALYVKASGTPLNLFTPDYFVAMDLDFLEGIRGSGGIDDEVMAREFKSHQLVPGDRLPSIESLMHSFIPAKLVAHTHPVAILKIVNRVNGRDLLKECFGDDLAVIPYARMGYDLAQAVSEAARLNAGCAGVVIAHHGLIVWGDGARAVYDLTIGLINKAEKFLSAKITRSITPGAAVSAAESSKNYELIAKPIRESIPANKTSMILLNTPDVLELINSPEGKEIITNPPMTPDYPMYSRILPVWVDDGITDVHLSGPSPLAIIHPPVGIICLGPTPAVAGQTADFVRQALSIRRVIYETGGDYESLPERYIFDMQYRGYQQAKKRGA